MDTVDLGRKVHQLPFTMSEVQESMLDTQCSSASKQKGAKTDLDIFQPPASAYHKI